MGTRARARRTWLTLQLVGGRRLPGGVICRAMLPFHQILQHTPMGATVEDAVNLVAHLQPRVITVGNVEGEVTNLQCGAADDASLIARGAPPLLVARLDRG